jgi:hypothetical protein
MRIKSISIGLFVWTVCSGFTVTDEMTAPMHMESGQIFSVLYGNEIDQNWSFRFYKVIEITENKTLIVYCYRHEQPERPISVDPDILRFEGFAWKAPFGFLNLSENHLRSLEPRLAAYSEVTEEERSEVEEHRSKCGLFDDMVIPELTAKIEKVAEAMKERYNQPVHSTASSGAALRE